jgi:hypothetical protein
MTRCICMGKKTLRKRYKFQKSYEPLPKHITLYYACVVQSSRKPLTEEGPKLEARRRIVLWIAILQGHN